MTPETIRSSDADLTGVHPRRLFLGSCLSLIATSVGFASGFNAASMAMLAAGMVATSWRVSASVIWACMASPTASAAPWAAAAAT